MDGEVEHKQRKDNIMLRMISMTEVRGTIEDHRKEQPTRNDNSRQGHEECERLWEDVEEVRERIQTRQPNKRGRQRKIREEEKDYLRRKDL